MLDRYQLLMRALTSAGNSIASEMRWILYEPIGWYCSSNAPEVEQTESSTRIRESFHQSGIPVLVDRLENMISAGMLSDLVEEDLFEAFAATDRFWAKRLDSTEANESIIEGPPHRRVPMDLANDEQLGMLARQLDAGWSFPVKTINDWRVSQLVKIVSETLILADGSAYVYRKDPVARAELTSVLMSKSFLEAVEWAVKLAERPGELVRAEDLLQLFRLGRKVLTRMQEIDERCYRRSI
jgi:hypothetical protein